VLLCSSSYILDPVLLDARKPYVLLSEDQDVTTNGKPDATRRQRPTTNMLRLEQKLEHFEATRRAEFEV
jgi:hypothetical protein